jgi:M6 family metalloprotease-like protein
MAFSAPFEERFTFTQPDGTKIELWGKGDEFHAVFETLDGFSVVFNPADKAYHYAKPSPDGSELKPVGPPVGKGDPVKLGLDKHHRISKAAREKQVNERFQRWDLGMQITDRWTKHKEALRLAEAGVAQPQINGPEPSPPSSTTTGTKVGLTLLIDFDDDPATIPQASIVDYCNGDSYTGYGNNGSIKKYFLDNSNNLLTYTNVVTVYIRIPNSLHPKSWYNDTTKDCGDQGNLLIEDAITIMKALPNYNTEILPMFSDLTVDGSNRVIAFNVFYAGGNGDVWSMGLWPHSWSLYNVGAQALGNGKSVFKYQITNIGSSLQIRTFCHENGHMLCGYPDLYDYGSDSTGGAGNFCLMGYGANNNNPAQVCAYLKRAAGWATTIELTSASNFVASVSAAGPDFNRFFRYKKPSVNTEYYLVENRQKFGRDANIPASGVAIWHIDELGNRDNQSTNYNSSHLNYEVSLMQADNLWHFQNNVNRGDSKDLYYLGNTAASYSNVFSDTSAPCARWWDGTPSGISFSGFSASATTMTFQVGIYSLFVTLPTEATEGDGVLVGQGQVSVTPTMTNNLTVTLASSDTSEVTVPASVVIPGNQSNVVFNLTIVNDAILDGDQSATVTATASACAPGAASMIVHDNETATLTVAIPSDAIEGEGTVSGTVYVSAPVATNVSVTLSSSDPTEATVPTNVVVATGTTNATFNITIIDDAVLDGPQTAIITAHVPNWTDGVASLTVLDNDGSDLIVTPSSYDFGMVTTGAVAQTAFTVSNAAVSVLHGHASIASSVFSIVAGDSFTVPGYGSTNVTVRFAPTNLSNYTGGVVFNSDGGHCVNTVTGAGIAPPTAGFSLTPTNGAVPLTVGFTDTTAGTVSNRFWDFGNGSTTNLGAGITSFFYSYVATGTNTVTLIATGPLGVSTNIKPNAVIVTAATGSTNNWVTAGNDNWTNAVNWTLGRPSTNGQTLVQITTATSKTITLDASATNTPAALSVSNLLISAPLGHANTLFVSGLPSNQPLRVVGDLTLLSGAILSATNSAIWIDNASGADTNCLDGVIALTNSQFIATNSVAIIGSNGAATVSIRGGAVTLLNPTIGGGASAAVIINGGTLTAGTNSASPTYLYIGSARAPSQLVVTNGGRLMSRYSYLGNAASGSSNIVLLTGSSSLWSNYYVYCGYNGSANQVLISGGARLVDSYAYMGYSASATGNVVTITGTGSVWSNITALYVGRYGVGEQVIVNNTGRLWSASSYMGYYAGSSSNVVWIAGSGSVWTNTSGLYVGYYGSSNVLYIVNGAATFASGAFVGFMDGAVDNAIWLSNGTLAVSALMITNGNAVTGFGTITGAVENRGTLSANGGTLSLLSGVINYGALRATNGGVAEFFGAVFNLGATNFSGGSAIFRASYQNVTSSTNAWIDTGNGLWRESARWSLGAAPTNTHSYLIITNANTKTVTVDALAPWSLTNWFTTVSAPAGSTNTLSVETPAWAMANVLIGPRGRLSVSNATLTAGVSGVGRMEVNGELALNTGTLDATAVPLMLADDGTATVRFANGVLLTKNYQIGDATTGGVTVIASGNGFWQQQGNFFAGSNAPQNSLLITDGAQLGDSIGYIGYATTSSNNTVLITGAGSIWSNSSTLYIGNSGAGNRLTVSNAAFVRNFSGYIGNGSSSSNNTVLVTGAGSIWSNSSTLYVGNSGAGNRLTVSNAAFVRNSSGYIGNNSSSSNNTVLVTGAGSLWTNTSNLYVGNSGPSNQLRIAAGGTVAASSVWIGSNASSSNNVIAVLGGNLTAANSSGTGVLEVRRGSLMLSNGTILADNLVATNDIQSVVNLQSGTLSISNSVINNSQPLTLGAATLQLRGGTNSLADGLLIATNATLTGFGRIIGNVTNNGSVVPLNTLTVTGDFSAGASGSLRIRISGSNVCDKLNISAAANLAGNLTVLLNGYTPQSGDVFIPLTAGSVVNVFSTTNLPSLWPGLVWLTQYSPSAVTLSVTGRIQLVTYDYYASYYSLGAGSEMNDANNNGIPNLMEYGLGRNPTSRLSRAATTQGQSNGWFQINFTRNSDATNLAYRVEAATLLTGGGNWSCILSNINNTGWFGPASYSESPVTDGVVQVIVTDTATGATNRFLRLRITRP